MHEAHKGYRDYEGSSRSDKLTHSFKGPDWIWHMLQYLSAQHHIAGARIRNIENVARDVVTRSFPGAALKPRLIARSIVLAKVMSDVTEAQGAAHISEGAATRADVEDGLCLGLEHSASQGITHPGIAELLISYSADSAVVNHSPLTVSAFTELAR
jgi:hypothetical protein